jgi:mannose-6-phosphate isomerase-like protein (cupin superfamily)
MGAPAATPPPHRRQLPVNLTEMADGMSWRDACTNLRLMSKSETPTLSIHPLDDSDSGRRNDSVFDTVYVVVSGYGVLLYGDKEMECTAGDVLLIPKGNPHQLDRMHGSIRIWMIVLVEDDLDLTD